MTEPIAKARLRPMIWPIFPPVIMNAAITSVYNVIAVWIPVTVVPTSLATVAIDTFITEVSSVIRNCAEAKVTNTTEAPLAVRSLTRSGSTDIAGMYRRRSERSVQTHGTSPPVLVTVACSPTWGDGSAGKSGRHESVGGRVHDLELDAMAPEHLRAGLRVSTASICWTVVTSAAAVALGLAKGSVVLVAFGAVGTLDVVGSVALVAHFRHALRHDAISDRYER